MKREYERKTISLLINKHTPADTHAVAPPLGRGELFAPALSKCHWQNRQPMVPKGRISLSVPPIPIGVRNDIPYTIIRFSANCSVIYGQHLPRRLRFCRIRRRRSRRQTAASPAHRRQVFLLSHAPPVFPMPRSFFSSTA